MMGIMCEERVKKGENREITNTENMPREEFVCKREGKQ